MIHLGAERAARERMRGVAREPLRGAVPYLHHPTARVRTIVSASAPYDVKWIGRRRHEISLEFVFYRHFQEIRDARLTAARSRRIIITIFVKFSARAGRQGRTSRDLRQEGYPCPARDLPVVTSIRND